MKYVRTLFAILCLLLPSTMSFASEPPKEPILRINTEMHTAPIMRVGIDAANRFVVTGSFDKTVRVWELASGRLISVLRPPIGTGNEGRIDAVAISPDGKTIACSGWTGAEWDSTVSIYLFKRESGELIHRITGLPNVVLHLSYSPDGTFLAVALHGNDGIRIYRTADNTLVGEDKDYGSISPSIVFDQANRFASASMDGYIRLYDSPGKQGIKLIAKKGLPDARIPFSVAFSPDSKLLAVSTHYVNHLEVFSAHDLSWLYSPDTSNIWNGYFNTISFSADGRYLYTCGSYQKVAGGGFQIIIWESAGKGERREILGANNTIMHILPLRGGGIIYAAGDPAFGILDKNHVRIFLKNSPLADYRDSSNGLGLSADGNLISFSYEQWGKALASFDIRSRTFVTDKETPDLTLPDTISMNIKHWKDSYSPELNGNTLKIEENTRSLSLAISPGKNGFLLGTSWRLRYFNKDGTEKWNVPLANAPWGVNISRDNRLCVAALGDGTIRWYRVEDGKELLAFLPHKDKKRWLMWIPEGYFDISGPDAAELIGYHLNQGKDKESKFIPLFNLYDVFYRPDIVQAKIRGEDISGLITLTVKEALATPPPTVKFTTVPSVNSDEKARVCYQVRSTGGGIGEIRLFQNGKLIKSDGFYRETARMDSLRKIKITALNSRAIYQDQRSLVKQEKKTAVSVTDKSKGEAFDECIDVETIAGENEISLAAFNTPNTVQGMMETITFNSTRQPDEPHLYIISVGIDNYRDPSISLKYAAKDARDFINTLSAQTSTIYKPQNVHVVSLTDKQAGKQDIMKAIDELSHKVKHSDGFIFFNASHGLLLQNQYYIVTADFNGDIGSTESLISSNEIVEMSKKIKSLSQLFIFDTCHAGGVDNIISGLYDARMVNLARKMGLHIFASAGSVQTAIDGYEGNGLYTYTLLQGIKNGRNVDRDGNGKVTIEKLGLYSKQRTTSISSKLGHKQTPYIINFGKDSTLFLVR